MDIFINVGNAGSKSPQQRIWNDDNPMVKIIDDMTRVYGYNTFVHGA